jgi:hypothetical protein
LSEHCRHRRGVHPSGHGNGNGFGLGHGEDCITPEANRIALTEQQLSLILADTQHSHTNQKPTEIRNEMDST